MSHDPPLSHDDHPHVITRNSRYGLVLFAIYLVLYGGFVALAAFAPHQMGERPIGNINLAILYGMSLIAAALVLAAIYVVLCRPARGTGAGQ